VGGGGKVAGWFSDKFRSLVNKIKEPAVPLSFKAKAIIVTLSLVIVCGGGYIAYRFYDFTQNNPKFCVGCHLMQTAYDSWAQSKHKSLNCHQCHHLTIPEQNQLLISFIMHRPTKVPERHGKVIVGSHVCNECHTSGDAPRINKSLFHAKHVYMEQLECTYCHGEVKADKSGLHRFLPTEKFCLKCHPGKAVHGEGMGGLACLNCHTDRTHDLKPGRKKCLFCHSNDDRIRKELKADATMDVRYFQPESATVKKAIKISINNDSPMQFYCYQCHKPHTQGKVRPSSALCMGCHDNIKRVGKHKVHLAMDMQCKDCHKPHLWRITEAAAKTTCTQCHEYRSPKAFF
jgi:nitrate/TMAO reductase-like tetraheme cytochrome c subunit